MRKNLVMVYLVYHNLIYLFSLYVIGQV